MNMKYSKNNRLSQKSGKKLSNRKTLLTWILLGVFVVVTIFFTIQTATSGATLAQLERDGETVIEENRTLSRQLIYLNSLSSLEKEAKGFGFEKPQKVIYIFEDEAVAKAP